MSKVRAAVGLIAPIGLIVLALILLQGLTPQLQYQRSALLAGEWWRVFTAHFVHFNGSHLAGNIIALLAIYAVFVSRISLIRLLAVMGSAALFIGVALLLFYPEVAWYNGLSGVLHGLVIYCALTLALSRQRRMWVLVMLIVGKVGYEASLHLNGTQSFRGDMPILFEAHMLGVIWGCVVVAMLQLCGIARARLLASRNNVASMPRSNSEHQAASCAARENQLGRQLSDREIEVISALIDESGSEWIHLRERLSSARVIEMDDGAMGSLLFVAQKDDERKYGGTICEAWFDDLDGVEVSLALNVDQYQELFELDSWKGNFEPLLALPAADKIEFASRR